MYSFPKGSWTSHLKRHLEKEHPPSKPQQAQLNIFGGHLATYIVQTEQLFSIYENPTFEKFIGTKHNPEFKKNLEPHINPI